MLLAHRDVRFLIHGVVRGSDAEADAGIFRALSGLGDRVEVRTDVLSEDDYRSWLGRADLLLLPYDPVVYRSRGSGVFTEAQRLGIPVIVSRGCDFARPAVDDGRGMEIAERSPQGIACAILAALERLAPLTSKALAAVAASRTADVESILAPVIRRIAADETAPAPSLVSRLRDQMAMVRDALRRI